MGTELLNPFQQQGELAAAAENLFVAGDLSKLDTKQRLDYYLQLCSSLGLNPATRPFEYIILNSKLTLYARKDATEQLRKLHHVSIIIVARELMEGVYAVTARATMPDGRCDESIGAVSVSNLKGEQLANAYMKAETKAKRRVTLSICGLGVLDELEVETIPNAAKFAEPPASPESPSPDLPTPPLSYNPTEFYKIAVGYGYRGEGHVDQTMNDMGYDMTDFADYALNDLAAYMDYTTKMLEQKSPQAAHAILVQTSHDNAITDGCYDAIKSFHDDREWNNGRQAPYPQAPDTNLADDLLLTEPPF